VTLADLSGKIWESITATQGANLNQLDTPYRKMPNNVPQSVPAGVKPHNPLASLSLSLILDFDSSYSVD